MALLRPATSDPSVREGNEVMKSVTAVLLLTAIVSVAWAQKQDDGAGDRRDGPPGSGSSSKHVLRKLRQLAPVRDMAATVAEARREKDVDVRLVWTSQKPAGRTFRAEAFWALTMWGRGSVLDAGLIGRLTAIVRTDPRPPTVT